jgi:putative NIF3 family GTP cyclohydrolase 1 type 2
VSRVAIVTGSGYDCAAEAAEHGCQVLITGDIREPTMAEARELGVAVIAAGHEATERYGVQALGAELSERFGIRFRFSVFSTTRIRSSVRTMAARPMPPP